MASRSFFIFLLVLLFGLSLSIILFELALTRIFSVVLWYNYAFMAISIAFFGLGIGSLLIHTQKDRIIKNGVNDMISKIIQSLIGFAISVPVFLFLIVFIIPPLTSF